MPRWDLVFVLLVAVLWSATPASAAEFTGRTSIIDGDTIEIHG